MNARRGLWVINVIGILVLTLSLALALDGLGTGEAWAQSTAFDETPPRALSPDRLVYEQLERLPLQPLEDFVSSLDAETRERLPPADLGRLIFEGDGLDLGALARSLLRTFVAEVSLNISLLGQLVLLGVFCALLRNIASTTRTSEAADVAFFVSLLVLLALGLQAFRAAVDVAETTLRTMVDFMQAILPLATMLAAVGAVTTAAIFHPLLYAAVTGIATLIESVLFPVVLLSAALAVVGSLSKDFPVKHLEGLLRTGILTALGMCFIAFFAVIQVRGAIAPVTDGFAFRTAKFLAGTFVPVVGGRIADAMDVIVGGSVLIKNALGVFGMATIGIITAFPIVKILSILAIFRLATALIEPITDPRLVQAMSGLAGSVRYFWPGWSRPAYVFRRDHGGRGDRQHRR